MLISRVGQAHKSRHGLPAVSSNAAAGLQFAQRRKRIRWLTSDSGENSRALRGKVKILSSLQDRPAPADLAPAELLSYRLDSGSMVSVRMRRSVCQTLMNHSDQSGRHGLEVAGVLAGYRRQVSAANGNVLQYWLEVTDVLPMTSSDSSSSYIRVDERAWGNVERKLIDLWGSQDKCKLGWYHTHPTQGIFFSRGDWEAHRLFPRPYQFALVVDPGSMDAGLFYWSDYDRMSQGRTIRFSLKHEGERE